MNNEQKNQNFDLIIDKNMTKTDSCHENLKNHH